MSQSSATNATIAIIGTAVAALLIGGGVGFYAAFALTAPPPCPPCEPPADSPQDGSGPGPLLRPAHRPIEKPSGQAPLSDDLAACEQRVQRLELELAMTRAVARGYEGQLHGTPQAWPEKTELAFRPEGFQENLGRAMDACEVPAELLGFDCEEPPCIAMLRPAARDWIWHLIQDCPDWTTPYRRVPLQATFADPCRPGETIVLLSPFWPAYPGDREQMIKRLQARQQAIREAWTCE
ncbi:MAG: hypothetical protein JXR96_10285 [Deltaproteobacteria bacterium]|nr:hypothetical protein [Deltaproteobacteria bacterium]